jgi:hypothetical protein
VPLWVKGRAISFYLTVLFGSFTVGSRLWGAVTTHSSIGTSLLLAGLTMALLLVLAQWFPLTLNEGHDLSPAHAGGAAPAGPDLPPPLDPALGWTGPVDVSVEYRVPTERMGEFLAAMRPVGGQRRRSGARHWTLDWASTVAPSSAATHAVYVERFRLHSAAEYARLTSRMTKEDVALQARARSFHVGDAPPAYQTTPPQRDPHAPARMSAGAWLGDGLLHGLDRSLEELERAIDRMRR